jgi:hypothetical protein
MEISMLLDSSVLVLISQVSAVRYLYTQGGERRGT